MRYFIDLLVLYMVERDAHKRLFLHDKLMYEEGSKYWRSTMKQSLCLLVGCPPFFCR